MGQDVAVGRAALDGHGGQEGGLEPAPVLVAALQVHLTGPGEPEVLVQHGQVRNARIEPHVQDVAVLLHVVRAAVVAQGPVPEQVLKGAAPPDGGPLRVPIHPLRQRPDAVRRQREGAAVLAAHGRHGDAPDPLAADAPVGAGLHHVVDAVVSPAGDPAHLVVDDAERRVLELRHVDEPLVRGAEDDGLLAAPAVGVAVHQPALSQQPTAGPQHFEGLRPPLLQRHAGHDGDVLFEAPRAVHGARDPEPVADARLVVLHAVSGGGVDATGAHIQLHVVRQHHQDLVVVVEGVRAREPLQLRAGDDEERVAQSEPRGRTQRVLQVHGQAVHPVAALVEPVLVPWMDGNGGAGGQRPGRRGPDDDVDVLPLQLREALRRAGQGVGGVDGGGLLVPVLDLAGRQGRLTVDAPVDGFQPAVDQVLVHHSGKGVELMTLVARVERDVGLLPLAEAPQAHKLLPLHVQEVQRCFPAPPAQLQGVHAVLRDVAVPQRPKLDGQAVGVPARNVGGVSPRHHLVLDDEVLQHLVEGRSQVDVAVGVGGAVVEHKAFRSAFPCLQGLVVDVLLLPELQKGGLPLRQIGPHGEVRDGKVQRVLIVLLLTAHDKKAASQNHSAPCPVLLEQPRRSSVEPPLPAGNGRIDGTIIDNLITQTRILTASTTFYDGRS